MVVLGETVVGATEVGEAVVGLVVVGEEVGMDVVGVNVEGVLVVGNWRLVIDRRPPTVDRTNAVCGLSSAVDLSANQFVDLFLFGRVFKNSFEIRSLRLGGDVTSFNRDFKHVVFKNPWRESVRTVFSRSDGDGVVRTAAGEEDVGFRDQGGIGGGSGERE